MKIANATATALTLLAIATRTVQVPDWKRVVSNQHHARMMSLSYITCYPPKRLGEKWRVAILKGGVSRLNRVKDKDFIAIKIRENPAYSCFFLPDMKEK